MDRKSYVEYVSKSGELAIVSLKMRTGGKRIRFTFISVNNQNQGHYDYNPRQIFTSHLAMDIVEERHRAEIEKPKLSEEEI